MKLPELVYQDESRNNRSCRVGDRDADPYAKCSEPSGKNQQAGNEEQHLPGERKEDRLLRHPDGKEKVCRHHLETDNRKDRKDDMQTVHRRLDQLQSENPVVATPIAHFIVNFVTSVTREYWRAPKL